MSKSYLDLSDAKLLVVDDVPDNLDILCRALEADDYNVLVATNGETALKVTSRTTPDLILLDVMMPGINGYETCKRLKENPETRDIPVIFLTALDQMEDIVAGFEVGGVDYVTKPFRKEEVLIRIRTHLERTRLALELGEKNRELADLNSHLEQKVEERTRELQRKVNELEGRDRIAQHLLTVHSLEDTLKLLLEVIEEVTGLSKLVIYLREEGGIKAAAAMGLSERGKMADLPELQQLSLEDRTESLNQVFSTRQPTSVDLSGGTSLIVPILRGEETIGMIEASSPDTETEQSENTISVLVSFALQAAVAISDSQFQQNSGKWKDQLDEVMRLDEVLENVEQLDGTSGESADRN